MMPGTSAAGIETMPCVPRFGLVRDQMPLKPPLSVF